MIEILEPRIAPAGIVNIKLVNGLLTAKTLAAGDGEEILVISQIVDGELRLDPAPGTRLRFEGQTLADGDLINVPGVSALSVSLGAGNDTLTIVNARIPKSLQINLGAGANALTLTNGDVSGAFSVTGGPSADSVTVGGGTNFTVGGKATVALGDGNNTFSSTVPVFTVARDFRLTSGSGSDTVSWTGAKLAFGAKFTAVTGDGADTVQLTPTVDVFIARNATISNSNTDPAAAVKQRIAAADSLNIGGNVKFAVNSGNVVQELLADTGSLTIGGSVTYVSGIGKSSQILDASEFLSIGGNLRLTTKAQTTASTDITTGLTPSGSFIGGSITLLGHQDVTFTVGVDIAGSMTVATGAGFAANVAIGFNSSIGVRIGGNLTIATSEAVSGTSNVSVVEGTVGGTFKLIGSSGVTNAVLNDSFFFGRVIADLGGNDDHYHIDDLGTTGLGVFYGPVTLRGGAGNDTFQIGGATGADGLTFRSTVLLDGGAGTDTVAQGATVTAIIPISMTNIP